MMRAVYLVLVLTFFVESPADATFLCGLLARRPDSHFVGDQTYVDVVRRVGFRTVETSYMRTNNDLQKLQKEYPNGILANSSWLKDKKVLDAGCGNGAFVRILREQGMNAYGVDLKLSEGQLAQAEWFYEADMVSTPFSNETFHVVFSTHSVFSYDEPRQIKRRALKELGRILKSEGRLYISPVHKQEMLDLVYGNPQFELLESLPVRAAGVNNQDLIQVTLRKR